jgi:dihydrofolate reductase
MKLRKLVVTEFLSLDGVMENPAWTFPYWNDTISEFKGSETLSSDALLMGRVTYEMFAAVWPHRTVEDDPGAEHMNNYPKYVVSTTLDKVEWNNSHLIKGDIVTEITKLKAQPGKDILVYGSATLVNFLLQQGLVDELRLLVYPVTVGGGKRLFSDETKVTLQLTEVKPAGQGVIALIYGVAKPDTSSP